jgi:hypothetical protein
MRARGRRLLAAQECRGRRRCAEVARHSVQRTKPGKEGDGSQREARGDV